MDHSSIEQKIEKQFIKTVQEGDIKKMELYLTNAKADKINLSFNNLNGKFPIIKNEKKYCQVLSFMLKNGLTKDIYDENGNTILANLALCNSKEAKKITKTILRENILDPDIVTESGQTPLMYAITADNQDMVRILHKYSDISIKDKNGNTAFDYAEINNNKTILNLFPQWKQKRELTIKQKSEELSKGMQQQRRAEIEKQREDMIKKEKARQKEEDNKAMIKEIALLEEASRIEENKRNIEREEMRIAELETKQYLENIRNLRLQRRDNHKARKNYAKIQKEEEKLQREQQELAVRESVISEISIKQTEEIDTVS